MIVMPVVTPKIAAAFALIAPTRRLKWPTRRFKRKHTRENVCGLCLNANRCIFKSNFRKINFDECDCGECCRSCNYHYISLLPLVIVIIFISNFYRCYLYLIINF